MKPTDDGADTGLQAVNSRFVAVDGRFAALSEQLVHVQHELQAIERRSEERCSSIDRRMATTTSQLDHVGLQLIGQLDQTHHVLRRIVLLGLLGTIACTAAMCLLTIVLALG